ncbi:MAG: hypothetical protein EOP84_35630 [Verrucomicrobiaceae bacterium]|nr:MAG: hypothetical protein EOP84_35630 [Verrucomicrobiaceae bacterium]
MEDHERERPQPEQRLGIREGRRRAHLRTEERLGLEPARFGETRHTRGRDVLERAEDGVLSGGATQRPDRLLL